MAGASFIHNLWYVAAWSHELGAETPIGRVLLNEPVVLWRRRDGTAVALEDRCPHRFAPLSLGRIEGDALRCMYHGLKFDCAGVCREMPARDPAPPVTARTYPVVERWNWIWVWMGDPALADPAMIPVAFGLDDPRWVMRPGVMEYQANWQLFNDNLCDLSHLDWSHETTLGGASTVRWSDRKPRVTTLPDGLLIERWWENGRLSPNNPDPVDVRNEYRYLLPGLFLMTSTWYAPGAAKRCNFGTPVDAPLSTRVEQQAVTPVSERQSRYFFATGVEAAHARPALLDGMFKVVNAAFLEDQRILEGQQRIIDLTPPDARMFATPHDTAVFAFRRLVAERLQMEADASRIVRG